MAEHSDEYKDILASQIESLGYRALATSHAFSAAMPMAPSIVVKKALVEYVWEELKRFEAAAIMYAEVRPGEDLHNVVRPRLSEVPGPESWLEMTVIQFLFDRAGRLQLAESASSGHERFAKLAAAVAGEERMHEMLGGEGGNALRNMLVTEPDDLAKAQTYFDRWLAISLRSFGRPGSARGQRAIALGLKSRDSADVVREYIAALEPIMSACDLKFPSREALGLDLPDDLPL
jgi:1,2-phenylacetyl-CoA epoxidase catalytic subunit